LFFSKSAEPALGQKISKILEKNGKKIHLKQSFALLAFNFSEILFSSKFYFFSFLKNSHKKIQNMFHDFIKNYK